MIEKLSQTVSTALVSNSFLLIPLKISLQIEKKNSRVTAWSLQSFLTLKLSQSGGTFAFSSSKPVAALKDCSRLGNALCLCLPVQRAQAVPERCPKSSAIDFAFETFDSLLK